jgi:predicted DNA-binding WGR domain protein
MKRWCLLKESDGNRGLIGKKKMYEIIVEDSRMTIMWGMAEKPNRQVKTQFFSSEQGALYAAQLRMMEKEEKGYVLAYSV